MELKTRQPCVATCSFFRCGQRALYIRYKNPQSRSGYGQQRSNHWEQRTIAEGTSECNWVGGECIIGKCVHAFCEAKRLLPDGSCGYEVKESAKQTRSIEEEASSEDTVAELAKHKVLKKAGREFIE